MDPEAEMIRILRILRTKIKMLLGREFNFKIQIKREKQWLGNSYGGFYLACSNLGVNSVIYSFGLGEDISFDEAVINKFGCMVFGFDPTPSSIDWLKNKKVLPSRFKYFEYGIDIADGMVDFYPPENPDHVSCSVSSKGRASERPFSVPMKSFRTITRELGHSYIDVLKMDIEGAEYEVIPDILSSEIHIEQIVIEFHHRFIDNGIKRTGDLVNLLNSHGYKIFAVSDSGEEVSFISCKC